MQSPMNRLTSLAFVAAIFISVRCGAANVVSDTLSLHNCKLAAEYSAKSKGVSMVVAQHGKIIFEDYPNGGTPAAAHELASGTKSFAGVAAIAAQEDGLLKLDEKVSLTINEWQNDPQRSGITIRQLLTLSSGIQTKVGAGLAPTYAEALKSEVSSPVFIYGPAPFQIFGEVMRRKLLPTKETMVDYLKRRVLSPAGVNVAHWRNAADGLPLIPQGARLTAREWEKFGELILHQGLANGKQLLKKNDVALLFQGTPFNPMYGLSWWLNRPIPNDLRNSIKQLTMASDLKYGSPGLPNDLVMAAGAGKQRLYVVPSQDLVVVRQAEGIREALLNRDATGFSDVAFLQLLTQGKSDAATAETATPKPSTKRISQTKNADRRQRLKNYFDTNHDGTLDADERKNAREQLLKRRSESSN